MRAFSMNLREVEKGGTKSHETSFLSSRLPGQFWLFCGVHPVNADAAHGRDTQSDARVAKRETL
jgi:hypothetical protein